MSEWQGVLRFLYGRGFWYASPLREVEGLTEEQLFWIPDPKALCALWHVGHIAHRERSHIGVFLQGLAPAIIPQEHEVFGPDWASVEQIRQSVKSVAEVFAWVRDVRQKSHEYISSLSEKDLHAVPATAPEGLSVSHWLLITACHTALHIGCIQSLRARIEDKRDRAC